MVNPECRVEYQSVCLHQGQTLRLAQFDGSLILQPSIGCNALVTVGEQCVRVSANKILLQSGENITVLDGCYVGSIIFCAKL